MGIVLACLLAAFAYLPILNNGFIADDYVMLKRVGILKTQPLFLYQVPPENFRFVSYVVFGVLKAIVGYQAWVFYAFNIALHTVNVYLLWRLLRTLVADDFFAFTAVLLFAVFQAPQEAVMWLAAMNETTVFFFTILALLAWIHDRPILAALAYACALFAKESAVTIPLFFMVADLYRKRTIVWQRYLVLLVPLAAFGAIFEYTLSKNFMLTNRSYSFGPQALVVLGTTIHRLLWPWFYIVVSAVWFRTRRFPSLRVIGSFLGAIVLTMLPYMFIAYQSSLPSRQLYLASAVLMTMFATLLKPVRGAVLNVVVAAFVLFNVGYLWVRKDGQFEQRAAPTTELVAFLRQHSPQPVHLIDFPYPLPEIPSSAALAVPGWNVTLVTMDVREVPCENCLQIRWNSRDQRYDSAALLHSDPR